MLKKNNTYFFFAVIILAAGLLLLNKPKAVSVEPAEKANSVCCKKTKKCLPKGNAPDNGHMLETFSRQLL